MRFLYKEDIGLIKISRQIRQRVFYRKKEMILALFSVRNDKKGDRKAKMKIRDCVRK